MADYSRYKNETLKKMHEKAEEKYFQENAKPCGNWGDGMRLSKLPSISAWEKAKQRLDDINAEIAKRKKEGMWNL